MNEQNALTTLTADKAIAVSWVKQHERLIIILMVLIFSFFVLDKSLGIVSNYESHKATEAEKVLDAQKAKNDIELATAKAMLSQYQTQVDIDAKEIANLTAAQASRDRVVVVQQKADAQLPPNELATRWQWLIGDSGVQTSTGGFTVTNDAAVTTVQSLEEVSTLKSDLADEQEKTAILKQDVDSANDLISQGKIVVNGLQLQLTDQTKACDAKVAAVKAAARKGKLKWFGIGYVSGFISGLVVRIGA